MRFLDDSKVSFRQNAIKKEKIFVMNMSVDDYVRDKVLPQYRPIVSMLRELIREVVPDVEELIYYGSPMYRRKKAVFAWITQSKTGIALGFLGGTEFEDNYRLLRGTGKSSKNIKMKSLDEVNKEALTYYIRQSIELNSK
jgi:hypothetical protein